MASAGHFRAGLKSQVGRSLFHGFKVRRKLVFHQLVNCSNRISYLEKLCQVNS